MAKTNKILNLKRLNFKNKCNVCFYLLKKILKIQPSSEELLCYRFYNELIQINGFIKFESKEFYILELKNSFNKTVKIRKRPSSDIDVFQQIYILGEYAPVVKIYKENFKNNNKLNIIDAGGNIGLTSLFFLENFDGPNVICVEPESKNFEVLRFNLNYMNCKKIQGAVWSKNSKIKIVQDFRDQLDWSFRVVESNESESIEAFSLKYLMDDNNFNDIDILKIDVEGSEKNIFDASTSDLSFLNKTKCISIEIHDEFNCREDIYNVLSNYGFVFENIGESTIGVNQKLKNN